MQFPAYPAHFLPPAAAPTTRQFKYPAGRAQRKSRAQANAAQAGADDVEEDDDGMLREFEHELPQDDNSTYALDSGAHPSHVKHPSRTMRKLHIPIPTHTATNSKTNATHYGHVQIQTSNNATMTLPAVANPALKKNLLSVNDIARQWGQVTFYAKRAAIYNTLHP